MKESKSVSFFIQGLILSVPCAVFIIVMGLFRGNLAWQKLVINGIVSGLITGIFVGILNVICKRNILRKKGKE